MYGVTWKQVWVKRSTCSVTAATTRGALLPTLVTEMPDARSIRRFPSTSSMIPPPARATNTPRVVPTPAGTAAPRRAMRSRERGPGISVSSSRSCGTRSVIVAMGASRARVVGIRAYGRPPDRATGNAALRQAGALATSLRGPRRRRTGTGLGAVDGGGVDFVGAHVGTVHEMRHALDPGTG